MWKASFEAWLRRNMHSLRTVCGTHFRYILPFIHPDFSRRPAQRGVQDWKNRISIRSFTEPSQSTLHASLTPYLCYACHTTLTSRSSRGTTPNSNPDSTSPTSTPLPVWVKSRLQDSLHKGTAVEAVSDAENNAEDEELWQTRKMEISDMKNAVADFLLE